MPLGIAAARDAARRAMPSSIADLRQLLGIPSISGSAAHRDDVARAVRWLSAWLLRRTPRVHVVPSAAGPIVLARVRGRDPAASTVVIYGHLDVRPAGRGWSTPPFTATIAGGRLIARGASDDKGQFMAQLVALDAWVRIGGPIGDVIVVAEAAEEIGSPTLAGVLGLWRDHPVLRGPVVAVVIADTRSAAPGVPSVTTSQRGSLAMRLSVDVGGSAVHAGRFGGAVLDPSLVLMDALARLRQAIRPWRRACASRTDHVSDGLIRARARGRAMACGDLDHRTTQRAAVTVSSWRTLGAPGSIPRSAEAHVDVRLPPGMDPGDAEPEVMQALRRGSGARCLAVTMLGRMRGDCLQLPDQVQQAVRRAGHLGYGRTPAYLASGGSLPAVRALEAAVRAPVVLLGLGPHDDNAHGPNEYLDLVEWPKAIDTCVCLTALLAQAEV